MGEGTTRPMVLAPSPLEGRLKVLAIDTAGWVTSVALWEDGQALECLEKRQEKEQAALLPQLVEEILKDNTIDQLLVNVGPGSFTGIRVGLAFAKGLSLGWDLPLKGINSFTVTYLSLEPTPEEVLILLDAHRQDVFGQHFQQGTPRPPQSLSRSDLETILSSQQPPLLAGSGVHPFLEGFAFKEAIPRFQGANALAHSFFHDPTAAGEAFPFYVRGADVNLRPSTQKCHSS